MRNFITPLVLEVIFLASCPGLVGAQTATPAPPIHIKVVVVTMFERGEDTGDAPGEFQLWVEREHLDQVLPLPAGYHHVRLNKDGVLGMVTGVGTAKAAASVMALGLDPRFDFSKAYWIVAGIGGGDPADVSVGSAVWADHVVDGDLAFEIDARQIPGSWPTGYLPLRKGTPYEQPASNDYGEVYTLNPQLVAWAFGLTEDLPLADSDTLRKSRGRFTGFPNALKPPFVARGDTLSASTFWHGSKMDEWANAWTRLLHRRQGQLHGRGHGGLRHAASAHTSESGRAGGFATHSCAAHRQQLRPRASGHLRCRKPERNGLRQLLRLPACSGSSANRWR